MKQLAEMLDMEYSNLSQANRDVKCVHDNDVDKLHSFMAGDNYIE